MNMQMEQKGISTKELIELYSLETSKNPFVQQVRQDMESLEERIKAVSGGKLDLNSPRVRDVKRVIERQSKNKGHGYLGYSVDHDREKEAVATALVASCFLNREVKTQPIIVPIDDFYRFYPALASLVAKTKTFDADVIGSKTDYSIILSGFSLSTVLRQDYLEQIPHQNNADLNLSLEGEFGKKFMGFAYEISEKFSQFEGNINQVLESLVKGKQEKIGSAKLLLATSLLLQDKQRWQDLWYESKGKGTSLYIVAPMSFHDAMNRLNLCWGHGALDYSHRASLGNNMVPLFGSVASENADPFGLDAELPNYENQGFSLAEFRQKVEEFL